MGPRKIVLLGTGGTIAGTAAGGDNVGYAAAQIGVADLVRKLPAFAASAAFQTETEQVAQLDSKDMDEATWTVLAHRCAHHLARADVDGLVVTHGTDTAEETAYFLQRVLAPRKPVVLACAMRPATALLSDGPQNLMDALAVVAAGSAGVTVVCAGRVHCAEAVMKVHPYRLDPFSSGEAGPLAVVEEGRVRGLRQVPGGAPPAVGLHSLPPAGRPWPWVELVTSHAGANGRAVDAMVEAGVAALVVSCTGNGSVHRSLEVALRRAMEAGVPAWRASRCPEGQIVVPKDDDAMGGLRVIAGLSPVKTRIAVQLMLLDGKARDTAA